MHPDVYLTFRLRICSLKQFNSQRCTINIFDAPTYALYSFVRAFANQNIMIQSAMHSVILMDTTLYSILFVQCCSTEKNWAEAECLNLALNSAILSRTRAYFNAPQCAKISMLGKLIQLYVMKNMTCFLILHFVRQPRGYEFIELVLQSNLDINGSTLRILVRKCGGSSILSERAEQTSHHLHSNSVNSFRASNLGFFHSFDWKIDNLQQNFKKIFFV